MCFRIKLIRDVCSLHLHCCGSLGIRPFVFSGQGDAFSGPLPTPYLGDRLAANTGGKARRPLDWSLRSPPWETKPSAAKKSQLDVEDVVHQEWLSPKDLRGTTAAAVLRH
eukprot:209573-Amphidinium_carterae.1